MPSTPSTTTKIAPTQRLRFIVPHPPCSDVSYSSLVRFRRRQRDLLYRIATLASLSCASVAAHDIPNDVTVQTFVKPAGGELRLLVRVPLKALRDIQFPERGPGYLDLERVDTLLPDAANLWIADFIEVYENGVRLPKPRVAATRISLPSDRSFASYDQAL